MRRYLVAGNWKMNGSRKANAGLLDAILERRGEAQAVELLVCPPFPYLVEVGERLRSAGGSPAVALGAQDVSAREPGAYTGEVAAAMLSEVGCEYAIVGHSERRSLHGEDDALVAGKFVAAQSAGLTPILCVGETLEQREANETEAVIERQVSAVVERAGIDAFARAVIAYEPVWAIGTGRTATPEQAGEVHAAIRALLAGHDAKIAGDLRILYGGSCKAANAAGLFAMPDIDGGLIGGASLDAAEFTAIAAAAAEAGAAENARADS